MDWVANMMISAVALLTRSGAQEHDAPKWTTVYKNKTKKNYPLEFQSGTVENG